MFGKHHFVGRLLFVGVVALAGCDLPNLATDDNNEPDPGMYRGQPIRQWILQESNESTRDGARANLSVLGPDDKELVPALITMLKDRDPAVRRSACRLLGQIGANARDALPDLEQAFVDPDMRVQREAIKAYNRVMPRP